MHAFLIPAKFPSSPRIRGSSRPTDQSCTMDSRIRGNDMLIVTLLVLLVCSLAACRGGADDVIEDFVEPAVAQPATEDVVATPAANVATEPAPTASVATPADDDGDGVPNADDNCPTVANPDQTNSDVLYAEGGVPTPSGEPVAVDTIGDLCDPDRDGDGVNATYVDSQNGEDAAIGTFAHPVRTLSRGIVLAKQFDDQLILAAGTYDVTNVAWPNNLAIRGGFAKGYGARAVKDESSTYATRLESVAQSTAITLHARHDLHFDGLFLVNGATTDVGRVLHMVGSGVKLTDCILEGTTVGNYTTALYVDSQSTLTMERSWIRLHGAYDLGMGVFIRDSSVRLVNNIIDVVNHTHARGVHLETSTGIMLHNTIRISGNPTVMGSSIGVVYLDASMTIGNNMVATEGSVDQVPLLCFGHTGAGASLPSNLSVVSQGQGPQPAAVDCDGTYSYGAYDVESLDEVIDPDTAALVTTVGVDSADSDTAMVHHVTDDFYGVTRIKGAYDAGAVEQ